jgi:type IV secretion system protein TrbC
MSDLGDLAAGKRMANVIGAGQQWVTVWVKHSRPLEPLEKENPNVKRNFITLIMPVLLLLPARAWAAGTGAAGLPWETPLRLVANSLTGPVALSIAIIALMAAGGILVFGGELNEFARRSCIAVLAIAFLVAGSSFMATLFGVSGAMV